MCTAATYKTKDFYFGRTLDYEFSYGDEITVTPRKFPFEFRHMGRRDSHYAIKLSAICLYTFCINSFHPVAFLYFISINDQSSIFLFFCRSGHFDKNNNYILKIFFRPYHT